MDRLFEASEKQGTISYSLHRACLEDKELSDFLNRRKLQHSLTQDYFNLVSSSFFESSPYYRDAARLRSLHGKGSGAWLNAIPSSQKPTLRTRDFLLAACLRMGLPMPFIGYISRCDCGTILDGSGYHLTCKWGGVLSGPMNQ